MSKRPWQCAKDGCPKNKVGGSPFCAGHKADAKQAA